MILTNSPATPYLSWYMSKRGALLSLLPLWSAKTRMDTYLSCILCLYRYLYWSAQWYALLLGGLLYRLTHEIAINIPFELSLHPVTPRSSDLTPNIVNEMIRRSECYLSHSLFTDYPYRLASHRFPLFVLNHTSMPTAITPRHTNKNMNPPISLQACEPTSALLRS